MTTIDRRLKLLEDRVRPQNMAGEVCQAEIIRILYAHTEGCRAWIIANIDWPEGVPMQEAIEELAKGELIERGYASDAIARALD